MINIITGSGRCGTSAVMQMLDAVGAPVIGKEPWYEPVPTQPEHFTLKWLEKQKGKYVKLINPLMFDFPQDQYRVLWLCRDPVQQFISITKLQKSQGRSFVGSMEQGIRNLERNAVDAFNKLKATGAEICIVSFEMLLEQPHDAASRIAMHFRLKADIDRMAAVIRERDTKAAEDMEHAISEGRKNVRAEV